METDPDGTWSWKGFGMIVAAIAIVAVAAVATAVTAGAAGMAIATVAGFSTFGVQAVGAVVGTTALISGVVAGSNEIVKQAAEKGAENINLLSVGISTVGGAVDGAFIAGSLFTNPAATIPLYLGRVGASGLRSYLYGLSEGYSADEINSEVLKSIAATFAVGLFMFSPKPVTLLSLIFKPVITGGIKILVEIGKNIWRFALSPLIDMI